MIHVFETDGSFADPAYLAMLVADFTRQEMAPAEKFGMLCCHECGDGPVVCEGLCNACAWDRYDDRNYDDVYDHKDYEGKHGGWEL